MDDLRRGFLKACVAAGTALVLPGGQKSVVGPTEILAPRPKFWISVIVW